MLRLTVFLSAILSFQALSQVEVVNIPDQTNPFYDIIEWKGMGAILMSRDAKGSTKQINLTLIGDGKTTIWDQKFNPKGEKFYYLASENARYVYFMDNLDPEDGKVYFSQLNSAGNIKSTSISISGALKSLGSYDYTKLELINVVVTDKALVHHLRYEDKKAKCIREFVVFTTHHNFLSYGVELGQVPFDNLKLEDYGQWNYIGFTGDEIYFAARDLVNKKKGWAVKGFTSKGKALDGTFLPAPENLITLDNIGFGTTGKYYLEATPNKEAGLVCQINGKFYMIGAQKKSPGAQLILFEYGAGEWKEINTMELNYFIENKTLKLGIYPMNEGIGYHLDHNGYNKASLISFTPGEKVAHNEYTEKTIANPSSVFCKKEKDEFAVTLETKTLYFDTRQLGSGTGLKFELRPR